MNDKYADYLGKVKTYKKEKSWLLGSVAVAIAADYWGLRNWLSALERLGVPSWYEHDSLTVQWNLVKPIKQNPTVLPVKIKESIIKEPKVETQTPAKTTVESVPEKNIVPEKDTVQDNKERGVERLLNDAYVDEPDTLEEIPQEELPPVPPMEELMNNAELIDDFKLEEEQIPNKDEHSI